MKLNEVVRAECAIPGKRNRRTKILFFNIATGHIISCKNKRAIVFIINCVEVFV